MKNVNVKVEMNAAGEITVVGLNKNGSVSATQYTVVETVGFVKASEPKASEPKTSTPVKNKKGHDAVTTAGRMFTNIKGFKHEGIFHAVKFEVAGKGECIVGFAKDRNQFIEHFNGVNKEVTRADVIKRMAQYQGKDAAQLTKMIQGLKPVSMAAGVCSSCGCSVNRGVKEYSERKFGAILCRNCQGGFTPEPTKKSAERSEARKCACGTELKGDWDDCSTCFSKSQLENHLDNEHVCTCGNTKERAFEQCEECRDTMVVVLDNQMTFKDARLLAEQEAQEIDIISDELPEFNVGYDYDYSEVTEEDKEGKSKKGKTKRSKGKTAEQKTTTVAERSEASSSSKGVANTIDYSELFDSSELIVNAGIKGMNGVDSEPVE